MASEPAPQRLQALEQPARRDLLAALAIVALGGALFVRFEVGERLGVLTTDFEHAQLDELLLTLALALVMTAWFAARRWRQARASYHALHASEQAKQRYVERLEALSSELLTAEERERHQLAERVHDDLGQVLYACRLRLALLPRHLPEGQAQQLAAELDALTADALERARELSIQLSPPTLAELGLEEALAELSAALSARFSAQITLSPSPAFDAALDTAKAPIFHSVQELVLNAVKHARAQRIEISAERLGAFVEVRVRDDGEGFEPNDRTQRAGFGLFGIERRMACLDASLVLDSRPGHGTTATLRVPAADRTASDA